MKKDEDLELLELQTLALNHKVAKRQKTLEEKQKIGNNKSYLQLPTYMLAGARSEDALDNVDIPNTLSLTELETESMPLIFGSIGGDDDETTGIRTTDCTDDTDESTSAWYDMQGRKYDAQPTKKGIYIYKGKKIVIRSTTK